MQLTEEQIDKELAKMFEKDPSKMLKFMLVRAGKECVASNAETLDIKTEANVGRSRYIIEVNISVKKVGKAIK